MNWMDKLERKWGRYAISNLNRYLVFAILIGYLVSFTAPSMMGFLNFSVSGILHGQIWRLITWVVIPPGSFSLWTLSFLFCLIPMGRTLESVFGTFRMNVYIIGGILISDLGGILIYIITYVLGNMGVAVLGTEGFSVSLSTYYILLSTFMALALSMPDATVNLYFVLPIKMKWMLLLYFGDLGYQLYSYFQAGYQMVAAQSSDKSIAVTYGVTFMLLYGAQIIFALLNLWFFFASGKNHVSRKQKKRQKEFRAQFEPKNPRPGSGISKHKCAICGRTELDDPNLTFRYCSKCEGNYEYCQDHLFTHQHIHRM